MTGDVVSTHTAIHICLVCHTEPDVWNGGYASFDLVLPKFVTLLDGIHDQSGRTPRVAWCLTGEVVRNRPQPFKELLALGHEIGVHSHFPGADGILEHRQDLNIARLSLFEQWFPDLCHQIADAGFPQPRTHASWMFAYPEHMTADLVRSGILVDCSVCYGGAHYLADGRLLADSRGRKDGRPCRPAKEDHCMEGNAGLAELPVSGGFGSYWEPDGKGGFDYFSPVASQDEMDKQIGTFDRRLQGLHKGDVDIFQMHFHLYEFLEPHGYKRRTVATRCSYASHDGERRSGSVFDSNRGDRRLAFRMSKPQVGILSRSRQTGNRKSPFSEL